MFPMAAPCRLHRLFVTLCSHREGNRCHSKVGACVDPNRAFRIHVVKSCLTLLSSGRVLFACLDASNIYI